MKLLKSEDVFSLIGNFGIIQIVYILLIGLMQIFVAFHMVLNIFTGEYILLILLIAIFNFHFNVSMVLSNK